jgi:hypothetical protein
LISFCHLDWDNTFTSKVILATIRLWLMTAIHILCETHSHFLNYVKSRLAGLGEPYVSPWWKIRYPPVSSIPGYICILSYCIRSNLYCRRPDWGNVWFSGVAKHNFVYSTVHRNDCAWTSSVILPEKVEF